MTLSFAPDIAPWYLFAFFGLCLGFCAYAALCRVTGSLLRMLAFSVALLWLLNPTLTRQTYKTTPSDVAVIVDQTASMTEGKRGQQMQAVALRLKEAAKDATGLHLRFITSDDPQADRTDLFKTLQNAGLSAANFGGAIFVTDGMVHDTPPTLPKAFWPDKGHAARPLDVILTGTGEEVDRRLEVLEAPTYGVVGKEVSITLRVVDAGSSKNEPAIVTVQAGTDAPQRLTVTPGVKRSLNVPVRSAGDLLVALSVSPLKNEVSTRNNVATLHINGIRERLKVLLVSGAPNPGERVWRRLLRADSSVDLVHFTILRTPEQDDGTPTRDMALVVFPTQDLFQNKIDQFDLIILDGFKTMGLLPDSYMENIARFVRKGGGLLLTTGPEFLEEGSLKDTPLADILPASAEENGVSNEVFTPQITALGRRHPVVNNLPPNWGPWYRSIKAAQGSVKGDVVLQGPGLLPLLILDQVGKGRVAMLMSDQIWLWSRGEGGGGPQAQLLRHLAHWLMKEPSLEAERLTGTIKDHALFVTRHSLRTEITSDVAITQPNGDTTPLPLKQDTEGVFSGHMPIDSSPGIWTIRQDGLSATVAQEAPSTRESQDLRATATVLAPLVKRSGGHILWSSQIKPDFKLAIGKANRNTATWSFPAGLTADPTKAKPLRLIPSWFGLALIILLTFIGWLRERKI